MQQLLYHNASFTQNQVSDLVSPEQRQRTQQEQQQHLQQTHPQLNHYYHQSEQHQHQPHPDYSSYVSSSRYFRKSNQFDLKQQKQLRKNMQNLQGRLHKNLLQQSFLIQQQHTIPQKYQCG